MKLKRRYVYSEPFFLQWHVTDRCNASCLHCYRTEGARPELSLEKLLYSLDSYERFLKAIGRPGRIQFTGGEPFLSPHLFTLLKEARHKNISCRILSNGTAITKEDTIKLAEAGCRLVQISIEGDQKTNDRIRGEGAFKKALEAMKLLRENGIEVTVNMTISRLNVGEIKNVMHISSAHARRFNVARFVPVNAAKQMDADSALSPDEVGACFEEIFRLKQKYPALEVPLRDPLWHGFLRTPTWRHALDIHGCSIGFNGLTLDCDGTVYPCRRLPLPLGNILDDELIDIWNGSPILKDLRDRDRLKGKCRVCKRRWLCGGCRAAAYALRNDYLDEDPQCPYQ